MRVGLGVVGLALAFPAAASADNTPGGPATLLNQWTGVSTLEGRPPEVLVGARIVVGAGGQAGTIRVRARDAGVTKVGDPVTLPAEPGTYTFAAPHIRWDYRSGQIGIDQETGDHAILAQDACDPSLGQGADPCQIKRVNVWTPPGSDADPTEVRQGAQLAVTGIFEPDRDEDFLGDTTEDRTDLRAIATWNRVDDGSAQVVVTITNAGPLAADLPSVTTSLKGFETSAGCKVDDPKVWWQWSVGGCGLARIGPGETRTVTLTGEVGPAPQDMSVHVRSEGPDLSPADNDVVAGIPAVPAFRLTPARSQKLERGVTLRVRAAYDGRARVTVAFRVRGRTVKLGKVISFKAGQERAVTVRATGAKLRSLRRAVRKRPLTARITVRTISGKTPISATTKVVR